MSTPLPFLHYRQACDDAAYLSKHLKGLQHIDEPYRRGVLTQLEAAAESLLHNLRMLHWWEIDPPDPDAKAKAAGGKA